MTKYRQLPKYRNYCGRKESSGEAIYLQARAADVTGFGAGEIGNEAGHLFAISAADAYG
jgi:hypothetical protein